MSLPAFLEDGNLPPGVHPAGLREVQVRFGVGSLRRGLIALRLERVVSLVRSSGQVARLVVVGSFVTAKPEPNDLDVFLLMENTFDLGQLIGEARVVFDHAGAQALFGASVFWMRRVAALGGEQDAIEFWQIRRDGGRRGIVEIVGELP